MTQRGPYGERSWAGRSGVRARGATAGAGRSLRFGFHPAYIILTLWLMVSTALATAAATTMHHRSLPERLAAIPSGPATPKYLVLFVLDGARPDYFGLTPLPHVDALRVGGTQFTNAFDGILEAETPAGHTTIATGSSPARNGILGFDWMVNDNDYSIFSPDVVNAGAMEHIMAASGAPTIAGLYKAKYPKAKVVALSGHKYYAADPLGGPNADAIMYYEGNPQGQYVPVSVPAHSPPAGVLTDPTLVWKDSHHVPLGMEDKLATDLALKTFSVMHQRITLINYPEFDYPLGHVDGGNLDPAGVITLMKQFDSDLGRIEDAYRKAGVLNQTLFVITADHGMGPTSRFIPPTVVTNAVAAAKTTAPANSTSTGDYIWVTDPSKAQTVAESIVKANDPGIQSVYYLSTTGKSPTYVRVGGSFVSPEVEAAHQYLLQTLMNGHEPSVVLFARAGQSFSPASNGWKADHGGAGWASQHVPLILAGPGIRPGVVSGAPAVLEDIAPTILTDMGVTPTGMEGDVLTEALTQSPGAAAQRARQDEINILTPLASALAAQDDYELAHNPTTTAH